MRRIIGIIGFIISAIAFYNVSFNNKAYVAWVKDFFGDGLLTGLVLIGSALSIVYIMGFILMIGNRPFWHVLFSGKRGDVDEFSNITDFIKMRNSMMGGMSPENAARLMNDTAIIDHLASGGYGSNTRDTMKYINGRLGGLSPKSQVKFLKGYKS